MKGAVLKDLKQLETYQAVVAELAGTDASEGYCQLAAVNG